MQQGHSTTDRLDQILSHVDPRIVAFVRPRLAFSNPMPTPTPAEALDRLLHVLREDYQMFGESFCHECNGFESVRFDDHGAPIYGFTHRDSCVIGQALAARGKAW